MSKHSNYLATFFAEKNLNREHLLEVAAPMGTVNLIPAGVVIDGILQTSSEEKKKITDILRKIDFQNGDVMHFLGHLAKALAVDF